MNLPTNLVKIYKESTTPKQRSQTPYHHIEPGFVNHRKCFSAIGSKYLQVYHEKKRPSDEEKASLLNDHLLVTILVQLCKNNAIKTLGETLFELEEGKLICSTEEIEGNPDVWEKRRVQNKIILPYESDKEIFLEYSPRHITSDTIRFQLEDGSKLSIIAEVRRVTQEKVILHPLVIGFPSCNHWRNKELEIDERKFRWTWYETFAEDINEFAKCEDINKVPIKIWMEYMKNCSEESLKEKLCTILTDLTKKDWGGEQEDIFTTEVHLNGKRLPTAFLLKGPSSFREMNPKQHFGKNGDQIYRLSCTPASLLVVQHCHKIGTAVRATLRAFAVNPANPRRYCLIDGKDTYKILKAYNQL